MHDFEWRQKDNSSNCVTQNSKAIQYSWKEMGIDILEKKKKNSLETFTLSRCEMLSDQGFPLRGLILLQKCV